jgi:hypothetical protein
MTTKNQKIEAIQFIGECLIEAAQADGDTPSLPSFTMKAYNGGVMSVMGFGDVVVDLDGMKMSDTTPILYGHDRYNIQSILGQSSKVENKNGRLTATGTIMSDGEIARQIVGLSKNGFKFQASIGATPIKAKEINAGEVVEVNGKSYKGQFTLIAKSELNEISIVPLGADKTTESRIAAQFTPQPQEDTMGDEMKTKTAEAIRAEAVAEEQRLTQIRIEAKDHPEVQAKAVTEGWNVDQTKLAIRDAIIAAQKAEIEASKVQNKRPEMPNIRIGNVEGAALNVKAIEASIAVRAGLKDLKAYDDETLNKADDLRINSFTDFVRAGLAVCGKRLEATRHETREFLQAAFSNRDIANILSNVANKFILQGYGTVEQAWRQVAAIRNVVDFKANTGVRLVLTSLLKQMGPGGEIQHGAISDETRTVQADTKALMLGLTRKDIINDDLGVLTELMNRLGYASARTFNVDFWAAFEAAVAANFETGGAKKNQQVGVLSLATLATAEKLFLELSDADGNPLGTEATTLLVSPVNSAKARELFTATNLVGGTTKDPNVNIYAGMFNPVVSRYISAAPWYLLASPNAMPLMEVAFLNGREQPFIESSDADFNTLGIQMRCYYDYGANFAEWRAGVRSTGAAS